METVKLKIDGMHCSACAEGIISNLKKEQGILDVSVNAITGKGRVKFEESHLSSEKIASLVSSYGFPAKEENLSANEEDELRTLRQAFFISLPLFLAIFVLHMFMPHSALNHYTQAILATIVQFVGGAIFYRGALSSLKTHNADMNLLIVLGTSSAYIYSLIALFGFFSDSSMGLYFEGSSAVITFVLLGEWLKSRAKKRSSENVRLLATLLPEHARVLHDGTEYTLPTCQINAGEICVIKAGEKIPLDGEIILGEAEVDSSHISGEYLPQYKKSGESVIGGSVLVNGFLHVKVSKNAKESLLFEMVDMLEEAQNQKPPIGKLADKIASIFVPSVVAISILTLLIWLLLDGDHERAFLASVAVLIISCPCALGLATPISLVSAISRAAKEGILIKNPDIIEKSSDVKYVVFDKTGTLTKGELVVDKVIFEDTIPTGVLEMIKLSESKSSHPISKALLAWASSQSKESNDTTVELSSFENVIGEGIIARFGNAELAVGNLKLMERLGILVKKPNNLNGLSVVYASFAGTHIASFGLLDSLRDEALESVDYFKCAGITPVILSGDSNESVGALANRLGIETFYAEVLPKDKHITIQNLRKNGGVIFIGDGVNDTLALEESDIGIALSSGTAIAQESGDVLLLNNDLRGICKTYELCNFALKNIKQNLFFAYIYNMILIPVAAGVLFPFFGVLLKPSLAGAAMAFSSVSVVGNALKIGRMKF